MPFGPEVGTRVGLLVALLAGLSGVVVATRTGPPRQFGPSALRSPLAKDALHREVLLAATIGLVCGAVFGVLGGPGWALTFGPATALAFGLAGLVAEVLGRPAGVDTIVTGVDPTQSWRADRRYGVVAGVIAGGVAGLTLGLSIGTYDLITHGPAEAANSALGFGVSAALLVGVVFGALTPRAATTLGACLQLHWVRGTPIRMIRFLEEARALGVLRAVGPIYQFRHNRLQDHLAAAYVRSVMDSNTV